MKANRIVLSFLLLTAGLVGCNSSDDDSVDVASSTPLVSPTQLAGVWQEVPEPDVISASVPGPVDVKYAQVFEHSDQLYIWMLLTSIESQGTNSRKYVQQVYFGQLQVDGDALSASLSRFTAKGSRVRLPDEVDTDDWQSMFTEAGRVSLSGVVVDADTLSFVLEKSSILNGRLLKRDFYLGRNPAAENNVGQDFLSLAGEWSWSDFPSADYDITFPGDTGQGFGRLLFGLDFVTQPPQRCLFDISVTDIGDFADSDQGDTGVDWVEVSFYECDPDSELRPDEGDVASGLLVRAAARDFDDPWYDPREIFLLLNNGLVVTGELQD